MPLFFFQNKEKILGRIRQFLARARDSNAKSDFQARSARFQQINEQLYMGVTYIFQNKDIFGRLNVTFLTENKSKTNQTFVNKIKYSAKSLYCFLKLQIFIDWNDHITHDRDSYGHLRTENKIEIDQLKPVLLIYF